MIDRVFGIRVRMSGLSINRYWPIIGRLLNADYRPADNRPLPYRCISRHVCLDVPKWIFKRLHFGSEGCWPFRFLHALEIHQDMLVHVPKEYCIPQKY